MPWKDQLKRLKGEFESRKSRPHAGGSQQQQQQQQQPPASVAPGAASGSGDGHLFGQPVFQPDGPVSVDWDAKTGHGENGWGNQELQFYTDSPENSFYTQDSQLVIRAIADNSTADPDRRYTSARLVSRQPLGRDRGVLTGLVLSPCAAGIWPAFWLLPQEPFAWPTDGEIDIAETWNGDGENRSCLHWGQHHEPQKHRVLGTPIADMHARPVRYDFVWDQPGGVAGQGRLLWYLDGRPVLKATVPSGTRPLRDFTILLNIAMGGNVCAGRTPADGHYDLVVDSLFLASEQEDGGWAKFDADWNDKNVSLGYTY